jgi:beta-phosphoglucomutase-like phosphatase (HAD superfamily)
VTALVRHCLGPLAEALELWVCGEDVERKKPDPQAYALALERLGLGPAAALAIEDTGHGLQAATAAGLGCVITLSHYGSREAMQRYAPALAVVEGFGPGGQVMVGPACGAAGVGLAYLQQLVAGRG